MRLMTLVLAAALTWPMATLSQQPEVRPTRSFASGNNLYEACAASEILKRQYCLAYVAGLTDAFIWDGFVCTPLHLTEEQVRDLVVNFLGAHPDYRHYTAASLAREALGQAFPCNQRS